MPLNYQDIGFANANLSSPAEIEEPNFPGYIYAADNHNYGNGNFAFTDPSTWGEGLSNAGKFIVSSVASGAASLYNTGVVVSNWLGSDAQQVDTGAALADLDSNLGKYYQENKESADLAGFIVTSFLPGVAGVKLLNAGQKALTLASKTGLVGTNLSRVTGLLTPATERYTIAAANEIAQSTATFSAISGNTLKALRSGAGQAALESAAFETAVAATMFKSPLLEDQDVSGLIKNAAIGTVLGGVIGGAITGAKIYGQIKTVKKTADLAEKPYTHINEIPGLTPAERIISRFDDLENTPGAQEIKSAVDDRVTLKTLDTVTRLRGDKENRLNNLVREDVHEMTVGKDVELGNQIADSLRGLDASQVAANLLHATEIGRLSSKLATETELAKFAKKTTKSGSADIIENTGVASGTKSVGYVKLLGEDAGDTVFDAPKVVGLADTFKNSSEVLGAVKGYGFKESKLWSALESQSHLETEARYIWADRFANLKPAKDGYVTIHEQDIPLLEKAIADKIEKVRVVDSRGFEYTINNSEDLFKHVMTSKQEVAYNLLQGKRAGTGITTDEIAKRVNVKRAYLEGEHSTNVQDDIFARQAFARDYEKAQQAKGLESTDYDLKPTWFKIGYDTRPLQGMDGQVLNGMAFIAEKYKIYQSAIDNVVAAHAGIYGEQMWHPSPDLLLKANSYGAGPGLFSFANGNYHSLESWAEQTGSVVNKFRMSLKDNTRAALEASAYKLASNSKAAIEFQVINERIASSAEKYVLDPQGTNKLVARDIIRFQTETAAGGKNIKPARLQEGAPEEIPIQNAETFEAIKAHIETNGKRVDAFRDLRAAQGLTDEKDAATFYPIRPNPKDYPHFSFVVDPAISGSGHVKMIHAATEAELEKMIDKVPANYQVIKKKDSEDFHRAMQDFQYSRTLHENYLDADLNSKGINSQFFPKTNPQKIATDWLESHTRADDVFARELTNAKFEREFGELRRLGEQYTSLATSKYGGSYGWIEQTANNPYTNYVKTALDISQLSEHPFLYGLNNILDSSFSRAANVISNAFGATKSPADLGLVNSELQKYGIKTAYYDAATELLANHSAPKGVLTGFIRSANSMLATVVLRLDPLNAINNIVGHNVLLGGETKAIIRAIQQGDTQAAGELGKLLNIGIPEIKAEIAAPSKLIANSMQRFFSDEGKSLSEFYKQNGWITSITDQYRKMLDDLTLTGSENVSLIGRKLNDAFAGAKSLAEKGETLTGNRFSEEFNRFVAADVMKQISDIGVKYGIIDEKQQLSYINTFVNRTQGNIQASQRPLMFQGAVGQAIGLFQTYQFNLMQQLFRHVSEGRGKDAAMMLGLQGTIYGMNGLPAFNAINTHILGTMSGNPDHIDAYSSTYAAAGKSMGDLLLYGISSNVLRANLYSRGDINPRQVTVIPTNPADVPFINATIKTFANVKDMLDKVGADANIWETLLQGIEHNGLSRPLAGIAQTAQSAGAGDGMAFSTSSKGNILGANDLFSWATVARLAGGKPLDESIVNDGTFRLNSYQAVDRAKKDALSEAIKSTVIGKEEPTSDQVESFASQYAAIGGKQKEFNKYMLKMIKDANTSQANKIMQHLQSPYSKNMQYIMGGRESMDGNDF